MPIDTCLAGLCPARGLPAGACTPSTCGQSTGYLNYTQLTQLPMLSHRSSFFQPYVAEDVLAEAHRKSEWVNIVEIGHGSPVTPPSTGWCLLETQDMEEMSYIEEIVFMEDAICDEMYKRTPNFACAKSCSEELCRSKTYCLDRCEAEDDPEGQWFPQDDCGSSGDVCSARVIRRWAPFVVSVDGGFVSNHGQVYDCNYVYQPYTICSMGEPLYKSLPEDVSPTLAMQNHHSQMYLVGSPYSGTFEVLTQFYPRIAVGHALLMQNEDIKVWISIPSVGWGANITSELSTEDLHAATQARVGLLKSHIEGYMEVIGIRKERLVWGDASADRIYAPELHCHLDRTSSFPAAMRLTNNIVRQRLERDYPDLKRSSPTLLLVKRRGRRRILNHDELVQAIEDRYRLPGSILNSSGLHFEVYDGQDPGRAEEGPVPERVMTMFFRAKIVFGPHGGGFSNMVASRPGTALLDMLQRLPSEEELRRSKDEGNDPAGLSFAFADLVRTMGMCHYSMVPEFHRVNPLRARDPSRLSDEQEAYFVVNTTRVIEYLEDIIAWQQEHPFRCR